MVIVPAAEIDAYGLHVANLAGMRRALGTLAPAPRYALTDGFPVKGLAVPGTAVWKGDATVGCIAAASILAKVTRDAIMTEMHDDVAAVRVRAAQGLHDAGPLGGPRRLGAVPRAPASLRQRGAGRCGAGRGWARMTGWT